MSLLLALLTRRALQGEQVNVHPKSFSPAPQGDPVSKPLCPRSLSLNGHHYSVDSCELCVLSHVPGHSKGHTLKEQTFLVALSLSNNCFLSVTPWPFFLRVCHCVPLWAGSRTRGGQELSCIHWPSEIQWTQIHSRRMTMRMRRTVYKGGAANKLGECCICLCMLCPRCIFSFARSFYTGLCDEVSEEKTLNNSDTQTKVTYSLHDQLCLCLSVLFYVPLSAIVSFRVSSWGVSIWFTWLWFFLLATFCFLVTCT